jgi:hypothetical protein
LGAQSKPLVIIEKIDPKKPSFRPSKWAQKLKNAKNLKLPKLLENCFEPVGKGGWPHISTWIMYVALKFFITRTFPFFHYIACIEETLETNIHMRQLPWHHRPNK